MRAGNRGLFVTGTDTGVGKTHVALVLARLLAALGVAVRPRKPAESGCPWQGERLFPQDAWALKMAAGAQESIETVCPFPFHPAVAPDRAARLAGQSLTLADLADACLSGVTETDFLLVEGAGGFYSPLAEDGLNADLTALLKLPVLLVAADRLGCIGHTLVTVEAIRRRGLSLAGVVLNRIFLHTDREMDNAAELERWLDAPVYRAPYGEKGELWSELAPLAERLAGAGAYPFNFQK
jgi:dethiobiotin synthetase